MRSSTFEPGLILTFFTSVLSYFCFFVCVYSNIWIYNKKVYLTLSITIEILVLL